MSTPHQISYEELNAQHEAFDACVAKTPEIDQFCSSSAWAFSAYEAFSPDYETFISKSDLGYVALAQSTHDRLGRFRQPLEASWCLASPFVGPDPKGLMDQFARACLVDKHTWDLLFLSGIEKDGVLYKNIIECFSGLFFVGVGPPVGRFVANLEDGLDGFLSRRSSKFRANLRRIDRRASEQELTWTFLSSADEALDWERVYQRILDIEARSWKGLSDTGIIDESMQTFYRYMMPRLNETGRLRVLFIHQGEQDVAFVFGGVFNGGYRGLQLSFDADFASSSAGNLAQYWMIQRLIEEGVSSYDLGSELEYKQNWAETRHETTSLVIRGW